MRLAPLPSALAGRPTAAAATLPSAGGGRFETFPGGWGRSAEAAGAARPPAAPGRLCRPLPWRPHWLAGGRCGEGEGRREAGPDGGGRRAGGERLLSPGVWQLWGRRWGGRP